MEHKLIIVFPSGDSPAKRLSKPEVSKEKSSLPGRTRPASDVLPWDRDDAFLLSPWEQAPSCAAVNSSGYLGLNYFNFSLYLTHIVWNFSLLFYFIFLMNCIFVSCHLGKDSSRFTLCVHVCPPPGFFKPSRFHPDRNNIRTEWYTGLQTSHTGMTVNYTDRC